MSPTLTDETRRRLSLNLYLSKPRTNRLRRRPGWLLPLLLGWAATLAAGYASYASAIWFFSRTL